jgi:hypothetical protein
VQRSVVFFPPLSRVVVVYDDQCSPRLESATHAAGCGLRGGFQVELTSLGLEADMTKRPRQRAVGSQGILSLNFTALPLLQYTSSLVCRGHLPRNPKSRISKLRFGVQKSPGCGKPNKMEACPTCFGSSMYVGDRFRIQLRFTGPEIHLLEGRKRFQETAASSVRCPVAP